jgi:hypothetical protein
MASTTSLDATDVARLLLMAVVLRVRSCKRESAADGTFRAASPRFMNTKMKAAVVEAFGKPLVMRELDLPWVGAGG